MAEEWVGPKEAAKRLGMTVQALGYWVRQGAPVRDGSRGREFCWPDFPRWRDKELERKVRESSRPKSLDEARQRKEAAEAEMAELELEQMRGRLATKEAVQSAWGTMVARFKARVVNLPAKAAPFLVALPTQVEVQTRLEGFVAELVAELREYGRD